MSTCRHDLLGSSWIDSAAIPALSDRDIGDLLSVEVGIVEPLTDALIWENGNSTTFRLSPGTFAHAMVLAEKAAKYPAKR